MNIHHTRAARSFHEFQYARASGHGYNKFTAALAGLMIDGHKMTDDCEVRLKYPKGRASFPKDFKVRKGYRLANYAVGSDVYPDTGAKKWHDMADDESGYRDCYRLTGLEYLSAIGYAVTQVI